MIDKLFDLLTSTLSVSAPILLLLSVFLYLLKSIFEKSLDLGFKRLEQKAEETARQAQSQAEALAKQAERRADEIAKKVEEIGRTSLDVKKGLREAEREALVALRIAVDKWEYFLQSAVIDFTMMDPAKADVRTLYASDRDLFLEVRVAVVRAGTYLRRKELEEQLMNTILKIRHIYYPLINAVVPNLIDLQVQLRGIDIKLKAFEQSGMKDMNYAPTEKDREENLRLQSLMTTEVGAFRDAFLAQYRSIAEEMVTLKEGINVYIYRPIKETDIDKD
ncbi:hypothetical protein [Desulfobulbus sp.]|uniref:hypothetical protein n=1 Tax=Desulfobulbus sp. TaxID=895 RepID=UPI0027B8C191|nr:hypothetical protein [Desulfobulbus sp.]